MFKKGHCRPLFYLFFVFSIQLTVNIVQYHFADDWIRTADLFRRKQPLYQLSHNHCPRERKCFLPVPANQRQRQDVSIWKLVHELLIQSSAAKNFFSLNKSFNAAHLRERERERERQSIFYLEIIFAHATGDDRHNSINQTGKHLRNAKILFVWPVLVPGFATMTNFFKETFGRRQRNRFDKTF